MVARDSVNSSAPQLMGGMPGLARIVNVVIGAVLVLSGLTLHSGSLASTAILVGAAVVVCELVAFKVPVARFGSVVAAVVLFVATISAAFVTQTAAGINIVASIVIAALALVPARERSPVTG
jgi:hypothetical protein